MANTIKILNKDYELFWSTQAMSDISELCGGIDKLYEWMHDGEPVENLKKFTTIIEILVNAAIKRDNFAVRNGFQSGEERPLFEEGSFATVLSLTDMINMSGTIFKSLGDDSDFEVPEGANIKKEEADEVLEEIRENRRKKQGKKK